MTASKDSLEECSPARRHCGVAQVSALQGFFVPKTKIMKRNEQLEKELADALALIEKLKRQLTLALEATQPKRANEFTGVKNEPRDILQRVVDEAKYRDPQQSLREIGILTYLVNAHQLLALSGTLADGDTQADIAEIALDLKEFIQSFDTLI